MFYIPVLHRDQDHDFVHFPANYYSSERSMMVYKMVTPEYRIFPSKGGSGWEWAISFLIYLQQYYFLILASWPHMYFYHSLFNSPVSGALAMINACTCLNFPWSLSPTSWSRVDSLVEIMAPALHSLWKNIVKMCWYLWSLKMGCNFFNQLFIIMIFTVKVIDKGKLEIHSSFLQI